MAPSRRHFFIYGAEDPEQPLYDLAHCPSRLIIQDEEISHYSSMALLVSFITKASAVCVNDERSVIRPHWSGNVAGPFFQWPVCNLMSLVRKCRMEDGSWAAIFGDGKCLEPGPGCASQKWPVRLAGRMLAWTKLFEIYCFFFFFFLKIELGQIFNVLPGLGVLISDLWG